MDIDTIWVRVQDFKKFARRYGPMLEAMYADWEKSQENQGDPNAPVMSGGVPLNSSPKPIALQSIVQPGAETDTGSATTSGGESFTSSGGVLGSATTSGSDLPISAGGAAVAGPGSLTPQNGGTVVQDPAAAPKAPEPPVAS